MRAPGGGRRAAGSLAAMLCAAAAAAAQTPTFSASTETVRVDVLVADGSGPIIGLGPKDFEVRDDGVVQTVDLATFQSLPLSVVLALDTSGSVRGPRLAALQDASRAIVEGLAPRDRAGLLTFSNALSVRADVTGDASVVRAALEDVPVSGDTALVDATQAALVHAESDDGRALVILLSDGVDTASFLSPRSVLDTARGSAVVVYGVSLSALPGGSFVRQVCAATGGRTLRAGSVDALRATFLRVLDEFRHRYVLSYSPRGVAERGWHRITVRVRNRRARVEARPGYFARP